MVKWGLEEGDVDGAATACLVGKDFKQTESIYVAYGRVVEAFVVHTLGLASNNISVEVPTLRPG